MPTIASKIIRRIRRLASYRRLPLYWWFHKCVFNITNTKFDISWCVFQESFLRDQYDIRKFLDSIKKADTVFFMDVGRNHGFIFYYTMYHIMRSRFKTSSITYIGIDPSPLKFVYFNFFKFLKKNNIKINYFLIDKAVVFNNEQTVTLKYGEDNFGNFNINESNYAEKKKGKKNNRSYIEITVETIGHEELKKIVSDHMSADALIIKIDCKNQTSRLFLEMLDLMKGRTDPYLVACEQDDSGSRDVSVYSKPDLKVLTASNAF